ncbi:MAG: alcohol dehydrogenase [Stappia sp.]|uniref:iron-containing alcohol dehydrogenase n=1 Tax=Stappia sp. TaxID=1870903 RepID=UPI000C477EAA|nr:iron-containing alcohol dehydrogenase [Stappia sp.]MAA98615.1 alcohol dehydrogenase [Stappia sp.]MBM20556.1 alcohol dehydrogenase [Stappia sp.]
MANFTLSRVPRIVSGEGASGQIGDLVGDLAGDVAGDGACVLLVADAGLSALGITARVAGNMKDAGHRVVTYDRIMSDPREERVEEVIALARDRDAGVVVALGGGSALDAGKLVAAALRAPGRLCGYRLAAKPLPRARPPLVCVPTTAGTGSETTAVSVVSDALGVKYWYWADSLKPDVALLDPLLTTGLPAPLTAACGMDAIVHAMEAATARAGFAENSELCHGAIRLAVGNLERAVAEPEDLDARGAMLLAAARAGMGIDNAGTGIAHMIAHALASLMPIHHGRAVALGMAASLSWSMEGQEDAYAGVANAFGCAHYGELPMAFCGLVRRLGISLHLPADTNRLTPERLAAQMARPENAPMRNASLREVGDADLLLLAERVVAG